MSDNFGIVDFKSELMVKNFECRQQIDIISNEFNWVSNAWVNKFGFENEFLGLIKNINYKAKNAENYKTEILYQSFMEL